MIFKEKLYYRYGKKINICKHVFFTDFYIPFFAILLPFYSYPPTFPIFPSQICKCSQNEENRIDAQTVVFGIETPKRGSLSPLGQEGLGESKVRKHIQSKENNNQNRGELHRVSSNDLLGTLLVVLTQCGRE